MTALEDHARPPQAPTGVPTGRIAIVAAIAIAIVLALALIAWLFARGTSPPPPPEETPPLLRGPFDPRDPDAPRARSWGFVDRDRGIVHMPLEVAAEFYLTQEAAR